MSAFALESGAVVALIGATSLVLVALIGFAGIWLQVRVRREVGVVHTLVNSAAELQARKLAEALEVVEALYAHIAGIGGVLAGITEEAVANVTARSTSSRTRASDLPPVPP